MNKKNNNFFHGGDTCVEIKTGTGHNHDGFLNVTIDGTNVIYDEFQKGELVLSKCKIRLQQITVSNPSGNAWVGTITITSSDKSFTNECKGCSGKEFAGKIAVDGDSNPPLSDTYCLQGATCSIIIKGTSSNSV